MKRIKILALAVAAAAVFMAFVGAGSAAALQILNAGLTSSVSGMTVGLASFFACGAAILRIGKNRQLGLVTVHSQGHTTGTAASPFPANALQLFNPQYDRKALTHPVMA